MTSLQTMYPGVANSPETFLKEALTIDGTIMYLADGSVLGEIPTLAVIGEGQQAETVLVASTRSDGGYTIERGVEGPKKAWTKATTVARNWTNKDYETLRTNITAIDAEVETKVDKIDGKGLSTNDYDGEAKAKVDAIPPDPKYTDTVPDLSPYAKNSDLMQQIADVKSELEQALESSEENLTEVDATLKNEIDKTEESIEDIHLLYVPKTDIINDLTTGGIEKALSAEQGKTLEDTKLDKTDVVNDLTTGGTDKALSAEQGKALEDTKLNKTDIVNDLTTGGADKALSAEQGKTLFTYADNGKKSIADAIVGKGVDATKSDSFGALADKISKIKTGYGVGDVIPEENVKVLKEFVAGYPEKIWEFPGHTLTVMALAIGPDGYIYSGGDGGELFKISPDGKRIWRFTDHTGTVCALAVDSDGYIYSGGDGGELFKISPDGERVRKFAGHDDDVLALAIGPDGSIYSGGYNNKVLKMSPDGKKIWEFTGPVGPVCSLAVDPEGYIYSGDMGEGYGRNCKVFKISPNGSKMWECAKHTNWVAALAVGPDGTIYSGDEDGNILKLSPDGQVIWRARCGTARTFAVSPDGSIYSGGAPNKIIKLSSEGQTIWELTDHTDTLYALAVGPDGYIYSGDIEGQVCKILDGHYIKSYEVIK